MPYVTLLNEPRNDNNYEKGNIISHKAGKTLSWSGEYSSTLVQPTEWTACKNPPYTKKQ